MLRLVRGSFPASDADAIAWSAVEGTVDTQALAAHGRLDAVVHLAGEGIANRRWTTAQKARLRDSRVIGTRGLPGPVAELPEPPGVLVSASAIGWYGDRGAEWVDETDEPGEMFLSDVCRDWEAATTPAREAGIRVVNHRIGVVLSANGGALTKMLLPFKLGLGGRVGSGDQYWSWITLDDLVASIRHVIDTETISGPVNAVAPAPSTNLEFTKSLGKALRRPTIFPMPAFVAPGLCWARWPTNCFGGCTDPGERARTDRFSVDSSRIGRGAGRRALVAGVEPATRSHHFTIRLKYFRSTADWSSKSTLVRLRKLDPPLYSL
ncbi:MAG: hypothetical protein CM1200mP2_14160 [Planctomycetaceae bacterium]|nr:MAG: hypothetical protein CM1200mP2_14160 [Planctomycetaceae bacterium]